MHISPKRKLLLSIVALGGVAVGVDRLILQGDAGPAQAAADLIPTALEGKAEKSLEDGSGKSKPGTVSATTEAQRVAVRLAALKRPADGPDADAFAPPAAWLARISPSTAPAVEPDQPRLTAAPSPTPATPALRLTLVTRRAGVAVAAVISGVRVGLGESVGGYRLVGLSASEAAGPNGRPGRPAKAVLEGPAGTIELALDPLPGPAARD